MANVSTANFTDTRTLPTNADINVSVCNLDPDLTIRDFIVLHNGALYEPQSNYVKITQTTLRYLGSPLGSTQIQVRRKTPVEVIQEVKFGSKLSSDLYNDELDRTARWKAEADLNGVGAALTTQLAIPNNQAYGVTWSGDTVTPPTRQAVYNQMELRAPKASPTFTGDVFVPNLAQGNNSSRAANTAYVDAGLATKANLASPVFTSDPQYNVVIPIGDNDFTLANTRFVKDNLALYALLNSPALVTPTATTTPATSNNSLLLATTAFVKANLVTGTNTMLLGGTLRVSWGNGFITTDANGDMSVFYPVAFSAPAYVTMIQHSSAGSSPTRIVTPYDISGATNFAARVQNASGTPVSNTSVKVAWIAIGAA